MKQNKSIIAFDIGASKIAYGVAGLPLSALSFQRLNKIKTPKSKKEIIEKIIEIVKKIKKDKKIVGVGIGMAGQMDFEKGIVSSSLVANGWKNRCEDL